MTDLIQNFRSPTNCKSRFEKYIFCHFSDFSRRQVKSDPWKSNGNSFAISLPFTISPYSGGESYFLSFVCLCGFFNVSSCCYEILNTRFLKAKFQL